MTSTILGKRNLLNLLFVGNFTFLFLYQLSADSDSQSETVIILHYTCYYIWVMTSVIVFTISFSVCPFGPPLGTVKFHLFNSFNFIVFK